MHLPVDLHLRWHCDLKVKALSANLTKPRSSDVALFVATPRVARK